MQYRISFKNQANQTRQGSQAGFTIVELMVATLVFSVILLVIMVGVVSFTNSYFRGINSSTTQTTTRRALEVITQAVQYSGGGVAKGVGNTYCVGNVQFDFVLGAEINGTSVPHALWQTPHNSAGPCVASPFITSGTGKSQELLGKNMRLNDFTITPSTITGSRLYVAHLHVIYGPDDLLYSPTGATPVAAAPNAACKIQTGSQFCAMVDLSSTVQKRVE